MLPNKTWYLKNEKCGALIIDFSRLMHNWINWIMNGIIHLRGYNEFIFVFPTLTNTFVGATCSFVDEYYRIFDVLLTNKLIQL